MVSFLKFFHLLAALGILGLTVCCLGIVSFAKSYPQQYFYQLNKFIILLSLLAMLTGTFLVYPKHFTFHTPWITAAYSLLGLFIVGVAWLALATKKWFVKWVWQVIYLVLIVVLVFIIHDAVTKTTFF